MSESSDRMTVVPERRSGTQDLAAKLFAERTEMLVLFCQVAGLEPFNNNGSRLQQAQKHLQQFCQVLMDYIAVGHFSLYERIINGKERRQSAAELAEKFYSRIAQTTAVAVDFNDKYDSNELSAITPELEKDLSRLGEELAVRAELEDRLLDAMQR